MKLVTFINPYTMADKVGLLLEGKVLDLNLTYAAYLASKGKRSCYEVASALLPNRMVDFLANGEDAIQATKEAKEFAISCMDTKQEVVGPRGEPASFSQKGVRLRAPIPRPGKIIHTAGNFREHAGEGEKSGWPFPMPHWISFLKSPTAVIGPEEPIIYPKYTKKLDHEIEVGIVIGKKGKYIPKEEAYDYIAGYTVFNDITARDIQKEEMKSGLLNFGKNMDTFAPLGPSIALKDEIPDPHNLRIELRVNGDVRQSSSTSRLSVTIPAIIEHYSWVTLEPGDIVTTGTVQGVAAFRLPDPTPYFLKPGDTVEAEVERIGILRNPVVAELEKPH